jgi:4-hydroxy-tetrahydrodipicolinate reductase
MMNEIRVVIFGLGSIGSLIARGLLEKNGIRIVGAVDIRKDIVGKDLGEVLGLGKKINVAVTNNPEDIISKVRADMSIIATGSYLQDVYPLISLCVKAGINVISTCEELSYPFYKYPELSARIDALAKEYHVTVLGTGINPGYLMDTLPIILTGVCKNVESIKVTRVINSAKRRISYQKKIGTGLNPEEFREMIKEKRITGHIGLAESIAMMASALGCTVEIDEFPPEPIIAEKEISTPYTMIKPGYVAGLKSVAHGIRNGKPFITLEFISHAAVDEEYDAILIEGTPKIYEKIYGGVPGDIGTVAIIINMIPKVLNAKPGLATMMDLPPPSCIMEDLRIHLNWKKNRNAITSNSLKSYNLTI